MFCKKSSSVLISISSISSWKRCFSKGLSNPLSSLLVAAKSNENIDYTLKETKLTQNLILYQVQTKEENATKQLKSDTRKKPFVIIFNWLYANSSSMQKYSRLYHDLGLDVLSVQGNLAHFLWPPKGFKLSCELLNYLKEYRPPEEEFFIHAFSVGAYNYTIAMQHAAEKPSESGDFRQRVCGQIFDSIVIGTYENMSKGIVQVLPDNEAFRNMVISTLDAYYRATHKTTKATYDKLVSHFKEDPISVPTLFYYSLNDPMCDSATMEAMIARWQSEKPDFEVKSVVWPQSRHAAHFREHKQEYLTAWTELMKRLNII